jgi:hypothetical protein
VLYDGAHDSHPTGLSLLSCLCSSAINSLPSLYRSVLTAEYISPSIPRPHAMRSPTPAGPSLDLAFSCELGAIGGSALGVRNLDRACAVLAWERVGPRWFGRVARTWRDGSACLILEFSCLGLADPGAWLHSVKWWKGGGGTWMGAGWDDGLGY